MEFKKYINKSGIYNFKISAGNSKNEFYNIMKNGVFKVRIKSEPENGKANKEILKFISSDLSINKNSIKIASGETCRDKRIEIIM